MELAKIKTKGQITIPMNIRKRMNLKTGDNILFFEEDGKYFLQNSNPAVLSVFQKEMEGAAKKAGFKNPDDVTKYIKKMRKSNKM